MNVESKRLKDSCERVLEYVDGFSKELMLVASKYADSENETERKCAIIVLSVCFLFLTKNLPFIDLLFLCTQEIMTVILGGQNGEN